MSLVDSISIVDNLGSQPSVCRELILDSAPIAPKMSSKVVSVLPVSSNSIGMDSSIQFVLPSKNLLKSGSAFLKFRCRTTASGPWSFSTIGSSAHSLFQNMTLIANGLVLENWQDYHITVGNLIQPHCATPAYTRTSAITEGAMTESAYVYNDPTSNHTFTWNAMNANTGAQLIYSPGAQMPANLDTYFTLDLNHIGLFGNKQSSAVPLYLLQSLQLNIQTNSVSKAFWSSGSTVPSSVTLDDFELFYTELTPEQSYFDSVSSALSNGKMAKIECQSVQSLKLPYNQTVQTMLSVGYNSLDCIVYGKTLGVDGAQNPKWFQAKTGEDVLANYASIREEVFIDGINPIQSKTQNNIPEFSFRMLREALGGVISPQDNISVIQGRGRVGAGTDNGSYINSAYAKAVPLRKVISDDCSMQGQKVSNVQLQFSNAYANSSSDTLYVLFVFSYMLVLDGKGGISRVA